MRKALLLAVALLASPAATQPLPGVPEPLRGAWFAGDCADPHAMLMLTGRAAAQVDAEAPAQLFRFRAWIVSTANCMAAVLALRFDVASAGLPSLSHTLPP
jgi:hypothetical protein